MIIIHAMNNPPLPRAVSGTLDSMMRVMPAVVVAGARQTGKEYARSRLRPPVGQPGGSASG